MAKVVWYSVPDLLDEQRFRLSLSKEVDETRPFEQECLLEQCAQHFFENNDGWDFSWPIEFRLFASEEGPPLTTAKVGMEMEPKFSAIGFNGRIR